MANPTTAKPTNPEWVNTASTVGELMQFFVSFSANGQVRDIVSNTLGIPLANSVGQGSGHTPILVPAAFTFNSLSDPVSRIGPGTMEVRFPGRGFGNSVTYPIGFLAVFKPFGNRWSASASPRTCCLIGSGRDGGGYSLGYQIGTGAGAITLGFIRQSNFHSSGITLTSGKTYLVGLTLTSTTGRLWNVYCYDDQSYVTNSSTGTSTTDSALSLESQNDAAFNHQINWNGHINPDPICDVHCIGIHTGTFDPATNGYFAALLADPCVAARGTYAGGGALVAGNCCLWDTTTTAISVLSNRPTGGTPASYQYALHRSTSPWAAAPVSSATRIVSLQSSPLLSDTTASAGQTYWYVVEQYDGTSTVYSTAAAVLPQQVSGRLSKGDVMLGVIGDSRQSTTVPGVIAQCLCARGYRAGAVCRGVSGASLYSVSGGAVSWQPNTTQDPVNGQSGTTLLSDALANFAAAGVTTLVIDLGANDADLGSNSAATFGTKLTILVNYLLSQSYTIYLVYPYQKGDTLGLTSNNLIPAYQSQISALVNGTTVKLADTSDYDLSVSRDIFGFSVDGLHFYYAPWNGLAIANGIANTLSPTASARAIVVSG